MKALFHLLIYIVFIVVPSLAQTSKLAFNPVRKIPVADLRKDFQIMRSALEELHPGLYWYTPKDSIQAAFDRTFASITQPLTEQEFINLLYPALCQIRCGHTQLEHSQAYRAAPDRPKLVHLPFDVFVQGSRAWLLSNHSTDSTLAVGTELLGINGVTSAQIIQTGLHWWNGDGYNLTWKEFFLNEYDFFEDICGKVYGWQEPYTLQVRDGHGPSRTVTVSTRAKPAESLQPVKEAVKLSPEEEKALAQEEEGRHAHLGLRFLEDSTTAFLTVNGLEYGDEAFYKESFRKMEQKQAQNLILDVRRNHGGDIRIISQLMAYLADSSFVILRELLAKTPNPAKNRFMAYFDPQKTKAHRAGYQLGIKEGNWYRIGLKPAMGPMAGYLPVAEKYRFRGKVYVLIDGGTFSSAGLFTAALKAQCAQAQFIGRETGGGETVCGGGTNQSFTLPHSQIVLNLPLMRMVSASHGVADGHGVQPTFPVVYTPQALAQHRDLDLEKALELIQSQAGK